MCSWQGKEAEERYKTELAEYEAEKEAWEDVTKPGASNVQNSKQEESDESGESEEFSKGFSKGFSEGFSEGSSKGFSGKC